MDSQDSYLQQWQRVRRWWTRVREVSQGRKFVMVPEFSEDDIFAFFLNCYHLKDWIKNDPASGPLRDTVEDFVNNSDALGICADLCNGLKHLARDKGRVRRNARFGPRTYRVVDFKTGTLAVSASVESDSGKVDAYQLATDCVLEWERFLRCQNKPVKQAQ
jgi:hypothetical protein